MDAYARMKSAFDKENIPELVARVSTLLYLTKVNSDPDWVKHR